MKNTTPPLDPNEILHRAKSLHQSGRLHEAVALYQSLLAGNPNDTELLTSIGIASYQLGQLENCIRLMEQSLCIDPGQANALNIQGLAMRKAGRHEDALASFDQAITLRPDNLAAYSNRGITLMELERYNEALSSFGHAIALDRDNPDFHYNRGRALHHLGRFPEALSCYDKAISLDPTNPAPYNNRGMALKEGFARHEEALASFDQAIALKPDYAAAHNNRGNTLSELRLFDQALASFDRAVRFQPAYAEAHFGRGNTLNALRQFNEALAAYHRAITNDPDYAEAYRNQGNTQIELKRFEDARTSFRHALELNPEAANIQGDLLYASLHLCAWDDIESLIQEILKGIACGKQASMPFEVLAISDSPEIQQLSAQLLAGVATASMPAMKKYEGHSRIRIGYFSADFHGHATMHLIAEMFERHDHGKFELFAFSFGPQIEDEWRKRAEAAFDQFIDVRFKSDREIALLARDLEIDIAVDLKGFTASSRTGILSHRAAPIQASYLGYPGTMGAAFIDYLIADETVIQEEMQPFYTEKIVYLPNSYQANDTRQAVACKTFNRVALGLPEHGFVFCSFNANFKILPDMFDAWMRLLRTVEGSVLWLLADSPTVRDTLRKEAAKRGIGPNRLVFAEYLPREEHLIRIQSADLFLDTFPYNAHTTASDALRAGLAVLTYSGRSFASRVCASLLNAVDLPELITDSLADYETLALELATNPQKLLDIKQKLRSHLPTAPLFDAALFTKHIEMAYVEMYQRHQHDLPPDHIHVAP